MRNTRPYRRKHVIDTVINDESCGHNRREITIHVGTLGMVNIQFGNSMTIRTDEQGLHELRDALTRTSSELLSVRTVEENTHGWPC